MIEVGTWMSPFTKIKQRSMGPGGRWVGVVDGKHFPNEHEGKLHPVRHDGNIIY